MRWAPLILRGPWGHLAPVTDRGVRIYITQVAVWFYVDDVVAQVPLDLVADFVGHWQAVFERFRMRLQLP